MTYKINEEFEVNLYSKKSSIECSITILNIIKIK